MPSGLHGICPTARPHGFTARRYGDEQHLEEALDRIFKPTRPGGVARKFLPTLIGEGAGPVYTCLVVSSAE